MSPFERTDQREGEAPADLLRGPGKQTAPRHKPVPRERHPPVSTVARARRLFAIAERVES